MNEVPVFIVSKSRTSCTFSCAWWAKCTGMHCLKMHFAHQPQLNAHVWPLETKMVVGHENDE
jgi:hypothetical protein